MELEELIENIDIVEYISQFVDLTEKNGEYWGLSPFTDEKTPSFSVRRETGSFYCFSSGIGGNVFTFVKHYNECSSSKAIEILNGYMGCGDVKAYPTKKMEAISVFKKYTKKKSTKKKSSPHLFADDCMNKFELRMDKLKVWEDEGISKDSLKKFGVKYDPFSDRLVYPIRDISGVIVNIGGRTLDPNWKEKGLRKYTYLSGWGGELGVIYGLFENLSSIKETHQIIIFEGAKSVMMANTFGIHNTGAILTSHLNPRQMLLLARIGCDVVFALDKEVDITKDHNIQKLRNYVNVYYIYDFMNLLKPKDSPVDEGEEVFRKLLSTKYKYRL